MYIPFKMQILKVGRVASPQYLPVSRPPPPADGVVALPGKPVILAPFSRELYAHFSQGPFRESLRVCLVKLSREDSLPVLRPQGDTGTVPVYTVSRARGTRRPRPCRPRRNRRRGCKPYSGPPADLQGVVRPVLLYSE